ncbi:MAG: hypothetical protein ACLFQ6_04345 [Candidatus Sumerlaeia bacterium]
MRYLKKNKNSVSRAILMIAILGLMAACDGGGSPPSQGEQDQEIKLYNQFINQQSAYVLETLGKPDRQGKTQEGFVILIYNDKLEGSDKSLLFRIAGGQVIDVGPVDKDFKIQ